MTEGNILKISIKLLENIIKEAYETNEETKLHLKNKKRSGRLIRQQEFFLPFQTQELQHLVRE